MSKYLKNIKRVGVSVLALLMCLTEMTGRSTARIFKAIEVQAAEGEQDLTGVGASYTSVLYNNGNGLPTSEANAIVQTSDGFIWIGCYSGLIRYDGNEFYRYDSSYGISSVVSLFEDSKKRLWIGTNENGVAMYENGVFKLYGRQEGLVSSSVRSITEDNEGNIYIATTLGMAYIDTEGTLQSINDPQLQGQYVCEIRSDSEGTIYGETISGAFFSIKSKRIDAYYSGLDLDLDDINCICPDFENPGYLYLGTEGSDIIYGNINEGMKDCKVYSVEPQVNINAIRQIGGRLWVCADNGIGYMTDDYTYVEMKNVALDNSIDDVIMDYEGDLWFVSSRQGVLKVAPSQFTNISLAAALPSMVVNTTCICGEQLFIGADTGLTILDKDYNTVENELTQLLEGARIRSIKNDSKGNIWLCTYSENGLICYHKDGTYTSFNQNNGFVSNRVRTIRELSNGQMAVSCSGGIYLLEDEKIAASFDSRNGINNSEILTIAEGENGVIYLGSDGDGIYRLDGNNVTQFGLDDGLKSGVILRIKKDEKRGLFWIITSNSIAYMKDEVITTVTKFPYSNNFDIFTDEKDNAWVLSSNGIYVTPVEVLMEDKEPEYIFYDTKCGLSCITTANSRNAIDGAGNLYISGTTGISMVNINEIESESSNIKLTVPFISVDGKLRTVKEGEKIKIPSNCKRLEIYGYALTYSLKNPHVRYSLEGFDDKEITTTRQEMGAVSYTNLPGGTYTFHLATVNTLTGELENSIEVVIIKQKAFYEHVTFWILVAILVVAAIVLLVRLYLKKKTEALIRKQEETNQFVDQIIQAFAKCIDAKDAYTRGHSIRVAKYSRMIAERMNYQEADPRDVYNIAILHDIGKISIPDSILGKPAGLTDEEYGILKQHAQKGYDILKEITIAPKLAIGAGYHHERLDGRGYPRGAKAEDIPMIAQIIAVADTFDAMYSTRPYRKQMKIEDVVSEMQRVAGTQLNKEVVESFIELIREGAVEHTETETAEILGE